MDSETKTFPVLFNINKNGKKLTWTISIEEENVIRVYGQVGGKLITVKREYKATNVGKKNATTASEQARFEAQKLWVSQFKKGYKPDDENADDTELFNNVMNKINSQGGNLHNIRGSKNEVKTDSSQGTIERSEIFQPMLAHKFPDYWGKRVGGKETNKLHFNPEGCIIQPKLDGIRGVAAYHPPQREEDLKGGVNMESGEVHITTRAGKEIVHNSAIKKELRAMFNTENKFKKWKIDGEFYVHDMYSKSGDLLVAVDKFRIINGGCRSKLNKPSIHEKYFEYHVFDMFDPDQPLLTYEERYKLLLEFFAAHLDDASPKGEVRKEAPLVERKEAIISKRKIQLVKMVQLDCPTEEELWKLFDEYIVNRYEGAMVKDKSNIYSGRRETSILKLKPEHEKEYTIVGGTCGEGTEEGCIVYELETSSGHRFTCRPRGSFADRKKAFKKLEKDIGTPYVVYYQEIDPITEIPIHCRGKDLRYDLE